MIRRSLVCSTIAGFWPTKAEKLETAAVRWHGRLETETARMRLADAQLARALLTSLRAGNPEAIELLRRQLLRQLRRLRPTLVPRLA